MADSEIKDLNGGVTVAPANSDLVIVQRGTGAGSCKPVLMSDIKEFSSSYFDHIVKASGTTYSSVGAVLAANPDDFLHILVDGRGSGVNETANIVAAHGVAVFFVGSWVQNNYKFDFSAQDDVTLSITSLGKGNSWIMSTSANGDEGGLLINKGNNVSLVMNDVVASNLSIKDDDMFINPNGNVEINNCYFSLKNNKHSGLDLSGCALEAIKTTRNVVYTGNGTSCGYCHIAANGESITNMTFDASVGSGLSTSTTANVITGREALLVVGAGYDGNITNLKVVPAAGLPGGTEYGITVSKSLTNFNITPGANIAIYGMSNNTYLSNINFGNSSGSYTGGRYIQYLNGSQISIKDSKNLSSVEDFGGNAINFLIDNVEFSPSSFPTFGIDYTTVTNCNLPELVTISAYGCIMKDNFALGEVSYDDDDGHIIQDYRIINANVIEDVMFASSKKVIVVPEPTAYNTGTTYYINDNVTYSGLVYRSKVDGNVGNQPDISASEWEATASSNTQQFTAKYGHLYVLDSTNYLIHVTAPSAEGRKGDSLSFFVTAVIQSIGLYAQSGQTIDGVAVASLGTINTEMKAISLGGTELILSL